MFCAPHRPEIVQCPPSTSIENLFSGPLSEDCGIQAAQSALTEIRHVKYCSELQRTGKSDGIIFRLGNVL
jgi:hypothetical protein